MNIFSKSVSNSTVPLDWKLANITPIFKKGVKSDPANYRPVSLTSVVWKILESIIAKDIVNFVEENNLFNKT